jgi:hypothetical protein
MSSFFSRLLGISPPEAAPQPPPQIEEPTSKNDRKRTRIAEEEEGRTFSNDMEEDESDDDDDDGEAKPVPEAKTKCNLLGDMYVKLFTSPITIDELCACANEETENFLSLVTAKLEVDLISILTENDKRLATLIDFCKCVHAAAPHVELLSHFYPQTKDKKAPSAMRVKRFLDHFATEVFFLILKATKGRHNQFPRLKELAPLPPSVHGNGGGDDGGADAGEEERMVLLVDAVQAGGYEKKKQQQQH